MTDEASPVHQVRTRLITPLLDSWRAEILKLIAAMVLVLNIPLTIIDVTTALQTGDVWLLIRSLLGIGGFAVVLFVSWLGFRQRAMLFLLFNYYVATSWLVVTGLVASGRISFFMLIVFAALLLGPWGTLVVWLSSLVTIAVIYGAFMTGLLPLPIGIAAQIGSPRHLVTDWLIYMMMSGAVGGAIVLTISRLQQSLRLAQAAQGDLQHLNTQLEQCVAERTNALRQSEGRYYSIFTNAALAISYASLDGLLLDANPAFRELLGYSLDELQHKRWAAFTHPDDLPAERDLAQQIIAGEIDNYHMDKRFLRKDGQVVWGRLTVSLIRDAAGQPQFVTGMIENITDRKQTEAALRESQQFVERVLAAVPAIVYIYELAEQRNQYTNDALHTLLGYTPEQAWTQGRAFFDLIIHPEDRHLQHEVDRWIGAAADGDIVTSEYRMRHSDSTWRWFSSRNLVLTRDASGVPVQMIGVALDVTERRQMEEALRLRVRQLEALRQTSTEITAELDLSRLLHAMLERAIDLLQAASGQVALYNAEHHDLLILVGTNIAPDLIGTRQPVTTHGTGAVIHTRQPLVIPDYQTWEDRLPHYAQLGAHALLLVPLLAGEQVLGIISIGHHQSDRTFDDTDIEMLTLFAQQATIALQNAYLFAEVQRLATIDPLTGLHNRRSLGNLSRQAYEQAAQYRHPLSVLMLDIDYFKHVNDTFGHVVGDQVLQAVARVCLAELRVVDIVGRYGGEEIMLVLPETDNDRAFQVAEHLRHTLATTPVPTDRGEVYITVSLGGITFHGSEPFSLEYMIDQADQALYAAKHAGRNQVIIWEQNTTG